MAKKSFNLNTSNNDEWLTPIDLIRSLGDFDLDPCSPSLNCLPWQIAKVHYDKVVDGLKKVWFGRVWCNPPYGKLTFKWLEKLAGHGSGIALIFSRTETVGFYNEVWKKAHSVYFLKGRIKFYERKRIGFIFVAATNSILPVDKWKQKQQPNAPSCLVSYSEFDTKMIMIADLMNKIKGKQVFFK